jgi:membrane-associated phospholipid phosphatase
MFSKTRPFLLLFLLFVLAGAWLLATYSKAALLLAVNGHYYPLGDAVMPWWTNFGDGGTHIAIIVVLIVTAHRLYGKAAAFRWGWLAFLAFALPSLLSQFLKSEFFNKEPRPVTYFASTPDVLHHVPGVELWTYNSFPSGHTITAFSIALTLLYLFAPRRVWTWSVLLFVWACSVAYSRMYLAEHFFKDVYGGAIIGVLTTLAALWIGERSLPRKWRAPVAQRP